jgi:hypothetical protein
MKRTSLLSPVALALGAMLNSTLAQVSVTNELVFRDTFDVSAPSNDIGFENTLRQSGAAGVLTYAEDAAMDELTQLGSPDAPGRLRLQSNSYVSPNHNFIEGGRFTIEFDVDPGFDDDPGDGLSGDWCGVVFGSTSQNPFIFSSDGMGILFRNDGRVEVWETQGQGALYSGSGDYPGGIPTGTNFHVRIEVDTANFSGSIPATIRMFVNDAQVRIDNNTLEHIKASGFRNNFITLEGLGFPGPWVHVFDNLTVSAVPCIRVSPENVDKIQGQISDPVAVTIPRQLNATQAAQVTVRSLDRTVAVPVGADANGQLTLSFPAGGTNIQSFTVSAAGPGVTSLILSNAQGACVINSVLVTVGSGVGVAEVLFQDNFSVSALSSDVNFENSLGRQNGSAVGVLSYSERVDTAAGGLFDDFTQVNTPDGPGKLALNITDFVWATPNYNFTDGGEFTLEFQVNPGANNASHDSDNWAAVVFGASNKGSFVNASDGMGILFRNDGRIQVFDGNVTVYGSDFTNALPAGDLNIRIETKTANFKGISPAMSSMFVNGTQVQIGGGTNLNLSKQAGFRNNYITFEGIGNGLIHTFDNIKVSALACIKASPLDVITPRGQSNATVTVTVPTALNLTNAASVTVRSLDPAVAVPQGAAGGSLTLNFAAGGPRTATFGVVGAAPGVTQFVLASAQGVCVSDPIEVTVAEIAALTCDTFADDTINSVWRINPQAFETGSADTSFTEASGTLQVVATGTANFWGGASLATELTFSAGTTTPVTFEVDRVAHSGAGSATRTGIFVTDQTRSRYVFFSDNVGEGGWTYNRKINQAGDNPTGGGININAFDGPVFDDLGNHRMKAVADGQTVKLYLDNILGAEVSFPVTNGIVSEFGAYTRAMGDTVTATFDNACVSTALPSALPCITASPAAVTGIPGQSNVTVDVTIPKLLNLTNSVSVTVTSLNPAVAVPGGAVNGALTLNFAAGATNVQRFAVVMLDKGMTTLRVAGPQGACALNDVAVTVTTTFLANPSFENNFNATFPGYGPIATWQGGSGVNNANGPFHDNGLVPDRAQIGFIQGSGTLSQMINGLVPGKQYWLQFRYNVRNCCGGTIDLTTRFDGADLDTVNAIAPVGGSNPYLFRQLVFTPAASSGLLQFASTASGDATVLVDAVTIVQRDAGNVVVQNPSFEAGGTPPAPGNISPNRISGWTGVGSYGVNFSGAGPFADNGRNPDQDNVAFIQDAGSLSQTVSNLTAGQPYTLSYSYNARAGNSPRLAVTIGGTTFQDETIAPVGGNLPYYTRSASFTAASGSALLTFAQTATGDQTVLLDNVAIIPGGVVSGPPLRAQLSTGNTVRISWPTSATGFVLQSTANLPGGWTDVNLPIVIEGADNVVTDTIGSGNKFYRLQKPQ